MTCPNCEAVVPEGERYCPNCGADLQMVSPKDETKQTETPAKSKKNLFKLIGIVVGVLIVIGIVLFVLAAINNSKGEKALQKVSANLGRSVAMAQKSSGFEFNTTSDYEILKEINDYNYIYESGKIIEVEGIKVPEWVLFITVNEEQKLDSVTYYNFNVVRSDWRGEKIGSKFDTNLVNYKTPLKEAKGIISMKPLSITCTNQDETMYVYKYHYKDVSDQNDKVFNLNVKYDIEEKVKSIQNVKCDYVSIIFK